VQKSEQAARFLKRKTSDLQIICVKPPINIKKGGGAEQCNANTLPLHCNYKRLNYD